MIGLRWVSLDILEAISLPVPTIRPALTIKLEDGGSGRRWWFVVTELILRPRCEIIKTRFDRIKRQPSPLAIRDSPFEIQRARWKVKEHYPSSRRWRNVSSRKKKRKKKKKKNREWMRLAISRYGFVRKKEKKGKKKKKKNHRGHARLFARWGSRIIRVWSVWYKVVKTGWRRKGSSSRSHWLGILIKNNQYCNINKCPSLLYQLPVPTSTAAAFSSFLPSKSIRPARHIVELQKTFLNAPRHPPTQHGSCQCDTNRVFVCPSYFRYYAAWIDDENGERTKL